MSTYPGNASLAAAVKDRVVATFDQTLALYRQGRTDEVIAGCNLILQMDPLFDPARKLLDKARDPSIAIDVNTLMSGGGDDPLAEARSAMRSRDFERVVQITTEVLTNDLMNDEARVLSDEARERIEAAPFVEQFVRKCQQHVGNGNLAAAQNDLEKARALDPNHPGIAQIETMLRNAESGPAATSFDSSSFVVDTPAPSTRSTAQASDFGFTFEEDKGGGSTSSFENFSFDSPTPEKPPAIEPSSAGAFSFDSPTPEEPPVVEPSPSDTFSPGAFSFDTPVEAGPGPAAAPPPSAPSEFSFDAPAKDGTEFDFSTASIETSPDDQKKIDQYLADGDRAFSSGDYQQAIDLWSRIFLIDVTNESASERIERAKIKRREIEQRMESVLAAGIQAFDRNDFATAKARFGEVLQADPGNNQAQDYLERIGTGEASSGMAFPPPPPPSFDDGLETPVDDDFAIPPAAASESFDIPPPPRKTATPAKTTSTPAKKSPVLAIAVAAALLIAAAAGWFFFSGSGSEPVQATVTTQSLITRAGELGQQGRFDEAIAVLQDIKPGDGQYEAALAMIADLQQKKGRAGSMIDGKPLPVFYDENIAAGRAAFAANDYAGAKRAFENAMRVKPLPPDLTAAYDRASQQVAKLDAARALFAERRYADAIRSLEALRAQDPSNKNVQRMIIDAHFNVGARALQDERLPDAIRAFDSVLAEDPTDELARRSKELAERYQGQPRDLLYRIYVKYLPLRQAPA